MSKYQHLKDQYNEIENKLLESLKSEIKQSEIESDHINEPCIKVNIFGFTEMAIINRKLTFLDDTGFHYNLWENASIDDLFNILLNL